VIASLVLRVAGLAAIYLLVLTSLDPGDVLVAIVLALGITMAASGRRTGATRDAGWSARRLWGALRTGASTAGEVVVGTGRVVRFCLGGTAGPGFVEIPRGDRSREAVALWGLLTGEAPDEYPVDVDEERGILIVHLTDARDPDAVRARHARSRDRHQRLVIE
jgi:multisubunit Na+/H+ antiporter MnhE subunit